METTPILNTDSEQSWLKRRTRLELYLMGLLMLTIIIAIILLTVMLFEQDQRFSTDPYFQTMKQDFERENYIRHQLLTQVSAENIQSNLESLTRTVHVAGTPENMKVLADIYDTYKNNGLDQVDYTEYEVLLSYPDYDTPNTVSIQDSSGSWSLLSNGTSEILGPKTAEEQEKNGGKKALIWWNAYAKNGSATGTLVYANYGRAQDFEYLEKNKIDVNNTIVLIRYGKVWRGSKTFEAEKRGAIGVIVYSDPADYGPPDNESASNVFPESIYMPPSGAQRGTMKQLDEDPMTPFYPAKNYTFRWNTVDDLRKKLTIPNVPVMPIGYRDAEKILVSMDGPVAPKEFQGGVKSLKNNYKLTGSNPYKIDVHAKTAPNTKIRNVIGYLRGQEEPDRWIMLSNHVDAWTFGSQDPNSGTAVLLELSRTIMSVVNSTGWRPRRTVVFCSWDAEEFGLVGSNEFVEEYYKLLQSRAIALINVDMSVHGNVSLSVKAVPLLYRAVLNATKQVSNPNEKEVVKNRKTIYDSWYYYYNTENSTHKEAADFLPGQTGVPYMPIPGSGSDHARFLMFAGVPVVDMTFKNGPDQSYPLYHSMYEIPWTVENLVDQNLTISAGLGQVWLELIRNLADSLVIPFNVSDYATMFGSYVKQLDNYLSAHGLNATIPGYGRFLENLHNAVAEFQSVASEFQAKVNHCNSGASATLRQLQMLNSRLSQLENVFIDPRGMPKREYMRHVVFSTNIQNKYVAGTFPGVTDSVYYYLEAKKSNDTETMHQELRYMQLGISVIQYTLESATLLLATPQFQ